MDGLVEEVLVEVVVDMLMTKATSRTAGAHMLPVVVMIGDVEMAKVNVPESRVVAHERRLPVVVEVVPRDGHPVGTADDVDLSVLVSC